MTEVRVDIRDGDGVQKLLKMGDRTAYRPDSIHFHGGVYRSNFTSSTLMLSGHVNALNYQVIPFIHPYRV